jgi:hypothetical protein
MLLYAGAFVAVAVSIVAFVAVIIVLVRTAFERGSK